MLTVVLSPEFNPMFGVVSGKMSQPSIPPPPTPSQNLESKRTGRKIIRKIFHPKELEVKIFCSKGLGEASSCNIDGQHKTPLTNWIIRSLTLSPDSKISTRDFSKTIPTPRAWRH
jgi:hypothetical protein